MKGYWLYGGILTVLIAVYTIAQLYKPQPIDWSLSFSREDKIPYGAYILYNELGEIFPSTKPEPVRQSIYETIAQNKDTNSIYLLIANRINFSKVDRDALLQFADRGNSIFIAANQINKILTDTLHCEVNNWWSGGTKSTVKLVNENLGEHSYQLDSMLFQSSIVIKDTLNTIVVGELDGIPNFVKFNIGKGFLYLNTTPTLFTNYYLLKKGFLAYVSASLSYLPAHPQHLYWDEYFKKGRIGSATPLRVILENPDLKWAYWTAIITLIVFVLFESKRRQRIIPEIKPLQNTTLEFVSTVGQLYYSRRDNKNIAEKKIRYFVSLIREKYRLNEQDMKEDFIALLTAKSGVEAAVIEELWILINKINSLTKVDDRHLIRLNHLLEIFYQKVNSKA